MSEQIRKWLKRRRVKRLIDRALRLDWLIKTLKKDKLKMIEAKTVYDAIPTDTHARVRYYGLEKWFNDELAAASYYGVTSIEGAEKELKEVLDKLDKERVDKTEQALEDMAT